MVCVVHVDFSSVHSEYHLHKPSPLLSSTHISPLSGRSDQTFEKMNLAGLAATQDLQELSKMISKINIIHKNNFTYFLKMAILLCWISIIKSH